MIISNINVIAVSLVELVGEIPPRLTVVVSFTVLTLYMEKSEPWSRYLPAIIECIQQLSNCLPLCPGSMSHVCDMLHSPLTLTINYALYLAYRGV